MAEGLPVLIPEQRQEVLLPTLAEGQAVPREVQLDLLQRCNVSAERELEECPLDLGRPVEEPVWTQAVELVASFASQSIGSVPRVLGR